MKKIILIICLFSLIICSCSKEKEGDYQVTIETISKNLYPFLFKKDSYWVYKNQATGQLDSTRVVSLTKHIFSNGPTHSGQNSTGQTEYYNINYESSIDGNYDEQLVGYLITKGLIKGGYMYLSNYAIGEENKNAKIADIYDTLTIQGNQYSQVVKMKNSRDLYLTKDLNLFYVDSIGIVQKDILYNDSIIETWKLIRYSVIL